METLFIVSRSPLTDALTVAVFGINKKEGKMAETLKVGEAAPWR
jgi:hypothetical protein